jgi:hypothetical protein
LYLGSQGRSTNLASLPGTARIRRISRVMLIPIPRAVPAGSTNPTGILPTAAQTPTRRPLNDSMRPFSVSYRMLRILCGHSLRACGQGRAQAGAQYWARGCRGAAISSLSWQFGGMRFVEIAAACHHWIEIEGSSLPRRLSVRSIATLSAVRTARPDLLGPERMVLLTT